MSTLKQNKGTVVAVVISLLLIASSIGWFVRRQENAGTDSFDVNSVLPPPITQPPSPPASSGQGVQPVGPVVTPAQLRAADGRLGHKCYVAVDATVYEIKQGLLWNNGQHDTSNGQAYCGADLSEAIKQSPHGKSKLSELSVVGAYRP